MMQDSSSAGRENSTGSCVRTAIVGLGQAVQGVGQTLTGRDVLQHLHKAQAGKLVGGAHRDGPIFAHRLHHQQLAHRDDDWVESDPRKIHKWFVDAVDIYGERLRRDCRYLKAWRDHHHLDDDKLSSIMLMACVWTAYEAIRGPFLPDREDERLLRVVERLPGMLTKGMPNPASKDEDLNRMSPEQRSRVAAEAGRLRDRLKEAVESCDEKRRAIDLMHIAFGKRVPDRPDLVSIPVRAEATITSQPKKTVPAPVVGRSQSG